MEFLKFLKSKVFWIQVGLAFVATFVLLFLVNVFLGVYTTSGRTILVPKLTGMTQVEVRESLRNSDLYLLVIDSVYNNDECPGAIVDQTPKPGQKVKKGRTIYVTINAFSKELTSMPNLKDFSFRNAQVNIENAGLRLGRVDYQPGHKDLVLRQSVAGKVIAPGSKIPKGTEVDLVVGLDPGDNQSVVPDLTSSTLRDALQVAKGARFAIGAVTYDATVKSSLDTLTAVVYRQAPAPSSAQTIMTPINIWMTTDVDKVISGDDAVN